MTTTTVLTLILIGLATGWVARKIVSEGGYGLAPDLLLGIAGSGLASVAFWYLGASPDTGVIAMAVAAFFGAAGAISAQRNVWAAPAVVVRRVPRARRI